MTIDTEFISIFLDEATDTLDKFERACLDLETNPGHETYDEMFRAAHNLKGASRAIGLEAFGEFVHRLEDLIQLVIEGALELSPELIATFLEAQVLLQKWVTGLRTNPESSPERAAIDTRIDLFRELGR